MKKIITLSFTILVGLSASKAQTFSDDFESYTVGSKLGPQSTNWTVWGGAASEGGTTDPTVTSTDNHTVGGAKSIYFSSTSSTGGPNDCVLPFGGSVLSTGGFTFTSWFKIPITKTAYFNFQGTATMGNLYTLDCWMNADSTISIQNSGTQMLHSTYPVGSWFELKIMANLSTNTWELFINGTSQGTWANTADQVYAIDIYPADAIAGFWVDDVSYDIVPYVLPTLNLGVTNVNVGNGLVGQYKSPTATVRNLGDSTITSFDIIINSNGTPASQSITGVNIASLATYTVSGFSPVALIAGANTFTATISNVNGLGADADATDNVKTTAVTPIQPALGKMVVAEEGTGTWCQWCPRGAVFMDLMNTKYDGFFAGIAVHNNDPMTNASYDAAIGPFIPGYPTALVDRLTGVDPSAMETDFLSRIQVAPKAFITNGATYNSSTHQLKISVTTTIQQNITGNYKMACVITEDSVSGTSSGYNQSNAYSGGGSGVMGGFELLTNPVPASQMNYNHVARLISPQFSGQPNAFGTSANAGQIFTHTFTYTLPAAWDINQIHIVGLFIDPTGLIDNATSVKISEAVTNGYITGTELPTYSLGVNEITSPDSEIGIYPNPSSDLTTISLKLDKETAVSVELYSVDGELVTKRDYGKLSGGMWLPLDMTTLSSGLYFVNIKLDEKITVKKLVKP